MTTSKTLIYFLAGCCLYFGVSAVAQASEGDLSRSYNLNINLPSNNSQDLDSADVIKGDLSITKVNEKFLVKSNIEFISADGNSSSHCSLEDSNFVKISSGEIQTILDSKVDGEACKVTLKDIDGSVEVRFAPLACESASGACAPGMSFADQSSSKPKFYKFQ